MGRVKVSKLKCVTHNRRVHVLDSKEGALTIHRNDGSRCVVNPLVKMDSDIFLPSSVVYGFNGRWNKLAKWEIDLFKREWD